jgi:hypothetical protein
MLAWGDIPASLHREAARTLVAHHDAITAETCASEALDIAAVEWERCFAAGGE